MKKKSRKNRHNKKRNTAFLYEVLVQETTKCVIGNDQKRRKKVLGVLREFFSKGKILYKERQLYGALINPGELKKEILTRVLEESKAEYEKLDKKEVFDQQTSLINKVNKEISPSVFSNFVQNYKSLATISQILNQELPVRERVLLESTFVDNCTTTEREVSNMEPTDELVYRTFVKNFNKKYEGSLFEEQKEILTRHAISFSDNGLSLRVYLNEEIGRLKLKLKEAAGHKLIKEDSSMLQKTNDVLKILDSYNGAEKVEYDNMVQIMEIQKLVRELDE